MTTRLDKPIISGTTATSIVKPILCDDEGKLIVNTAGSSGGYVLSTLVTGPVTGSPVVSASVAGSNFAASVIFQLDLSSNPGAYTARVEFSIDNAKWYPLCLFIASTGLTGNFISAVLPSFPYYRVTEFAFSGVTRTLTFLHSNNPVDYNVAASVFASSTVPNTVTSTAAIFITKSSLRKRFTVTNVGTQNIYLDFFNSVSSTNYSYLILPGATYSDSECTDDVYLCTASTLTSLVVFRSFL